MQKSEEEEEEEALVIFIFSDYYTIGNSQKRFNKDTFKSFLDSLLKNSTSAIIPPQYIVNNVFTIKIKTIDLITLTYQKILPFSEIKDLGTDFKKSEQLNAEQQQIVNQNGKIKEECNKIDMLDLEQRVLPILYPDIELNPKKLNSLNVEVFNELKYNKFSNNFTKHNLKQKNYSHYNKTLKNQIKNQQVEESNKNSIQKAEKIKEKIEQEEDDLYFLLNNSSGNNVNLNLSQNLNPNHAAMNAEGINHQSNSQGISQGTTNQNSQLNNNINFLPSFNLLAFIQQWKQRKLKDNAEPIIGAENIKSNKSNFNQRFVGGVLNEKKVVRTLRYKQENKYSKKEVFFVLNIYEVLDGSEYEAVFRIGDVEGTCQGEFGSELKFPIGNLASMELFVAHFKGHAKFDKILSSDVFIPKTGSQATSTQSNPSGLTSQAQQQAVQQQQLQQLQQAAQQQPSSSIQQQPLNNLLQQVLPTGTVNPGINPQIMQQINGMINQNRVRPPTTLTGQQGLVNNMPRFLPTGQINPNNPAALLTQQQMQQQIAQNSFYQQQVHQQMQNANPHNQQQILQFLQQQQLQQQQAQHLMMQANLIQQQLQREGGTQNLTPAQLQTLQQAHVLQTQVQQRNQQLQAQQAMFLQQQQALNQINNSNNG
ncbi:hypothetical protein HK099_003657 [Clydaea vesicula]|uniref:Uncharacterized protein n=1 Tax=Clydaea vesicula TaxID=447962 RepID=A0AAD5XW68_9FUNG|nr:hypothetical protein HK099_003657 [Clydaea vesicula]